MDRPYLRPLLALAALLLPLATLAGTAKIAVTDVRNVQGVKPGTASILTDIVVSEVARSGFDVISQADIASMVGFERQKQLMGCSEETSCLAEIGGALGVDYLITGQVGQIGSRFRISLLAVATKRARVIARAALFSDNDEDDLARAAEKTIAQLLATIRSAEPPAQGSTVRPPPARAATTPPVASPSLKPEPAAREAEPSVAPPPPGAGRARGGKAAWITLGSGGALLVGGLVTGLMAKSAYADLEAQQGERGFFDYYQANAGKVRTLGITSDVLTGVGLATAGVGAWLWWRGPREQVAILPAASNGTVGLVAAGRF